MVNIFFVIISKYIWPSIGVRLETSRDDVVFSNIDYIAASELMEETICLHILYFKAS